MFQEYLKAGKPPCLVYKLYNFFDRHSIVVLLFKTVNALKMEGEKKKKKQQEKILRLNTTFWPWKQTRSNLKQELGRVIKVTGFYSFFNYYSLLYFYSVFALL